MNKLLAVLLSLMLIIAAAAVLCASAAAYSYVNGDADGDGVVSSLDVMLIQRVVAGICTDEYGDIAERANVTGGELTLIDATAIQRYLAEFKDDHHIGDSIEPTVHFVFPTEDNQIII